MTDDPILDMVCDNLVAERKRPTRHITAATKSAFTVERELIDVTAFGEAKTYIAGRPVVLLNGVTLRGVVATEVEPDGSITVTFTYDET